MSKPPTPENVLATLRQKHSAPRVVVNRVTFGAELKAMRRRARISQIMMADKVDVSPATLCYFEKGDRTLTEAQQLTYIRECMKPLAVI